MRKSGVSSISSILVSVPCIIAFVCFTVIASVFQQVLVAGFCFCVFLVSSLSRLWGMFSIKNVFVEIVASSKNMFAGESANVQFSVKNEKLMPLIWLELLLPMPYRFCIMPDEEFETAMGAFVGEEAKNGEPALKKRFAFVSAKDVLTRSVQFSARRRGVYRVDSVILRSGDGLGLTQAQTVTTPAKIPVFVVYPAIRPIDITPFMQMQWDGTGGERGYIDDLTVMRGMRQYEAGDSWKHINWRMAARQQDININLYETVMPKAMHFVVDGESFASTYAAGAEFEEMLSLLASLLLRLTEAGVLCGISLPKSKHMSQTDVVATPEAHELLTLLAEYDLLAERDEENPGKDNSIAFMPASFEMLPLMRAARHAGRMYYVTRDAKGVRMSGLPQEFDKSKTTLLTYLETSDEDVYALGIKCMKLTGAVT